MDARFRRRFFTLLPLLAAVGCNQLDRTELAGNFPSGGPSVARGQAPEGPIAPLGPIGPLPAASKALPPAVVESRAPQPAIVPVAGAAAVAEGQTQIKVVATVAGEYIVTDDEVAMMLRERAHEFVNLAGAERERKEKQVYREELRKLVDRELVLHDFLARIRKNKPGIVDEVWDQAKQAADKQIREFRKLANLEDEERFTQYLKFRGTDYRLFRRFFERTACMSIFLNGLQKENNRGVSLGEIQTYYRDHPDDFRTADRAKWQHVFVSTARFNSAADAKLYAEWLQQQVKQGGDVPALAKQYGHGDSALRGGEGIGEKRGEIHPLEVETALWALKAGEVSAVIPDANGFHIVKAVERDVAGAKPLDDKTQMAIRNKLLDQAAKRERDRFVADLWRKYTVILAQ